MAEQPPISEAFISYSRKDIEFARKLVKAMRQRGPQNLWIDWEDIAYAEDWWKRIQDGIDGAETFIFIITPESVQSEVCYREIDHAVETGKRIIPILRLDVEDEAHRKAMHWAISRHNWLPMREADDFDEGVMKLITTLETDLEYVRLHTQLMLRAREWEENHRDSSLLLRGSALNEARIWLLGAQKPPSPTKLHINYIEASQNARAARRRFVSVTWVSVIGLMVAVGLLILLFRNEQTISEQQEQIADIQANIALANRLNAQSTFYEDSQYDLALLLSLAARQFSVNGADNGGLMRIMESNSHIQTYLREPASPVMTLEISPDGAHIAGGGMDGVIHIWDAQTWEHLAAFAAHDERIRRVMFSPDGKFIASSSLDLSVRLWDARTFEPLADPLIGHNDKVRGLAISPDSNTVISGDLQGVVIVWDVSDPTQPRLLQRLSQPHFAPVNAIAYSPDGSMLATGDDDSRVAFWMIDNGLPVFRNWEKTHTNWVLDLAFNADGTRLVSGAGDRTLILWDTASGSALHRTDTIHDSWVISLDFTPDGNRVVSGGRGTRMFVWNTDEDRLTVSYELFGHVVSVLAARFAPNGVLYTSGEEGHVIAWDIDASSHIGTTLGEHAGNPRTIAFLPGSETLVYGDSLGVLRLWDVHDENLLYESKVHGERINHLSINGDGTLLATASDDFTVGIWSLTNVASPSLQSTIDNENGSQFRIAAFHPTKPLLVTADRAGEIIFWDVSTPQQPTQQAGPDSIHWDIHGLAFLAEGTRFVTGGWDRSVQLWHIDDGFVNTFESPDVDLINSVAYSSRRDRVLAGGFPRDIHVWDASTGAPAEVAFVGHRSEVTSLSLSPDDTFLASVGDDRALILWDFETAAPIGIPLRGHTNVVAAVQYSPDGNTIATGGEDGRLVLWNVNFDQWPAMACRIANRNLTPDEVDRFIGERNFAPVCPDLPS